MLTTDDVTCVATICLSCVAAGVYRRLDRPWPKKVYGAGVGALVTCLVCGAQAHHALIMVAGNLFIITVLDRNYIHDMSLAWSWLYLVYLQVFLKLSPCALSVHQTLALRLVGLASDLHTSDFMKRETGLMLATAGNKFSTETDVMANEPELADMILYSFNFIGLHKGPYYRWRTYQDSVRAPPRASLEECRALAEDKIKKVAMFAVLHVWICANFPLSAYSRSEFYTERGADYRLLYNVPQLARFVVSTQMLSLLSGAVCAEAGFLVESRSRGLAGRQSVSWGNPQSDPQAPQDVTTISTKETTMTPAAAPTRQLSTVSTSDKGARSAMTGASSSGGGALATVRECCAGTLLLGPTLRRTLRSWDLTVQTWLHTHVHRKIDTDSRLARSTVSFAIWAVWYGANLNTAILASTLWLYVSLESVYWDKCERKFTSQKEQMACQVGFSLMRILCLIYVTPCLFLRNRIVSYYNSILWFFHILMGLLAGAVCAVCKGLERSHQPRTQVIAAR